MLLVDFYNNVYDTNDRTIELCDEVKLEALESLGILKNTIKCTKQELYDWVLDDKVCTDYYENFTKTELARARLTGVLNNSDYKIDIEVDNRFGVCDLRSCRISSDRVNLELPFYCYLSLAFMISSSNKIDYLKIYKKGVLGLPVNRVQGRIYFNNLVINELDLSELYLENTCLTFTSSNIGLLILNDSVTDLSRLLCESTVDSMLVDFSKVTDLEDAFLKSVCYDDIDLSVADNPNCKRAFKESKIYGSITVGQCSSYSEMFHSAVIRGKVTFTNCTLRIEDYETFFNAKINTLDLRECEIDGDLELKVCNIDVLILSKNCTHFFNKKDVSLGCKIRNLVIDGVDDSTDMMLDNSTGVKILSEDISELTFIDCADSIINIISGYLFDTSFYKLNKITIVHEDCERQKECLKQYMVENFTDVKFLLGADNKDELKKYFDEIIV